MNYFVTAIGTDSGKTLVSAILCEALKSDYWKPVQAGFPRDAETVGQLISNTRTQIHPEAYVLNTPASPHAAAKIDGVNIRVKDFTLPASNNGLVVEGAGGCLVPLNNEESIVDLILHLKLPAILVADLYLGSINHTLLTFEALHHRRIEVAGIVFNGDSNPESERIILQRTSAKLLMNVKQEPVVDKKTILRYAALIKSQL